MGQDCSLKCTNLVLWFSKHFWTMEFFHWTFWSKVSGWTRVVGSGRLGAWSVRISPPTTTIGLRVNPQASFLTPRAPVNIEDEQRARHWPLFLRRRGRKPVGEELDWGHEQLPGARVISQGCGQGRSGPPLSMPPFAPDKPGLQEQTSGIKRASEGLELSFVQPSSCSLEPVTYSFLFVPQQLKNT